MQSDSDCDHQSQTSWVEWFVCAGLGSHEVLIEGDQAKQTQSKSNHEDAKQNKELRKVFVSRNG